MYTLHKLSRPSYTKEFTTLGELTAAVKEGTCALCIDSYGSDLESMLVSECGCEFSVDGLTLDGPLTEEEHMQNDYEAGL